ncbi:sensor histidine kinase [Actinomadura opuntiae]|uniref:sensor histidine kinase n=1 Tax=Actinomadura sp. OS1-43 TaxID=604315 RepID=UPI00255ADD96|nr:histidine kinase [Actinomadura sp. OS1-43]MDL4815134.1 histidine kinase [Actinomadura sp. OS1-43]
MRDRYAAVLPSWWRAVAAACALGAAGAVPFLHLGWPERAGIVALLAVQGAAAALLMRERPEVALGTAAAAGAGIQALGPEIGPGIVFVVLCAFAWLRPARVSLWGMGAVAAVTVAVAAAQGRMVAVWPVAALLAWSWGALGRAGAARRHSEARRAALEERARIGRELHDVLSHTVSVMVVQAAAADDVFDSSPDLARRAVRNLEAEGRQALAELRHFLRSVRDAEGADPAGSVPGLGDLDRLVASVAGAGLQVRLHREGMGDVHVPSGVGLAVYRIVQEALTNTLRHARTARADVVLRVAGGCLDVDVHDDGPGGNPGGAGLAGSGQGIAGMRERAQLLGGTFEAGPDPAGGFRVRVSLPLEAHH